jgi:hypothetical protein
LREIKYRSFSANSCKKIPPAFGGGYYVGFTIFPEMFVSGSGITLLAFPLGLDFGSLLGLDFNLKLLFGYWMM